jgi:hypothetical protein
MSRNRLVAAAVAGGMVIFLWGAVSHMALPLGGMGLGALPAGTEEAMTPLLADLPHGAYLFPGQERESEGPAGFLVSHPRASGGMTPMQLVRELLGDVGAALVAAVLLPAAAGRRAGRVAAAAALGLFAWFAISFPQWNWYRFPASFVLAEAIDQVAGWTLAGLAMSYILPSRPAARD